MKWNNRQASLIKDIMKEIHTSKEDTIKIFIHGGKGFGKSLLLLWLINFICERTPGMTALVVRRTFKALKTDTMNILKRTPYPGILTGVKGHWEKGIEEFHYDNGSVIYFNHLENNTELTYGPSMGLIFIEEIQLCEQDDYEMIKLRLRQYSESNEYFNRFKEQIKEHILLPAKNYLILNANPRASWVQKELIKGPNRKEFIHFSVSTKENQENLPKNYINPFMTEAMKARQFEDDWSDLNGLIYPEFSSRNQVNSNFNDLINIKDQNNYVILDPGFVTSRFAVLFGCVLNETVKYQGKTYAAGTKYIYDELVFNGKDVEAKDRVYMPELAAEIKKVLKKYDIGENYIGKIDPAANRQSILGPSETQVLISHGIHLSNAKKTQEQASFDNINIQLKSEQIIVSMECINFLQEIECYIYKINDNDDIDAKEIPINKDNDLMDCFKYFMNEIPTNTIKRVFKPQTYNENASEQEILSDWSKNLFKNSNDISSVETKRKKLIDYGLL